MASTNYLSLLKWAHTKSDLICLEQTNHNIEVLTFAGRCCATFYRALKGFRVTLLSARDKCKIINVRPNAMHLCFNNFKFDIKNTWKTINEILSRQKTNNSFSIYV